MSRATQIISDSAADLSKRISTIYHNLENIDKVYIVFIKASSKLDILSKIIHSQQIQVQLLRKENHELAEEVSSFKKISHVLFVY